MKINRIILFALLFSTASGCKKVEVVASEVPISKADYIIFSNVSLGWGCKAAKIYKIENQKLYLDESGSFCKVEPKDYVFKGNVLEDAKFKNSENILKLFPAKLLEDTRETIGCPGCADGGMLYLEIKKDSKIQRWRIDDAVFYKEMDTNNQPIPSYLSNYAKEVKKVLEIL
jgi:hypothetical protein